MHETWQVPEGVVYIKFHIFAEVVKNMGTVLDIQQQCFIVVDVVVVVVIYGTKHTHIVSN